MSDNMKKLVSSITNELNSFSFSEKKFCEEMTLEHRTLQQSFTRLCIAWLRYCAALEDWQVDGRNEASVRVGKIVSDALDDAGVGSVPLV